MDPLSISASIIALLQATNAVLSICYDYSCAVNGAPWGLSNLIDETRSLRNVLEALVRLVHEHKAAHLPTLRLLCQPYGPVENGVGRLEELENRLSSAGYKARVPSRRRAFFEALTWPLREAETKRTTEQIGRLASTLSFAMQTDQTRLMLAIEDLAIANQKMTAETRDGVAQLQKASLSVQDDARRQNIKAWLAAPDPSINHNAARSKRYPSTGEWLFKSKEYKAWRKDSFTTLWMRGPVGCGKTILTSAMIDNLVEVCNDDPSRSLAYFYFDFNDPSRRTPDAMLRSLISQLIMQRESVPAEWDSLFFANGDRQPTIEELLSIVREMMQKPQESGFLVVDALDECVDSKAAGDVLDKIDRWDIEGWWLFVTSRKNAPGLGTELFFNGAVFSIPVWRVRNDIHLYIQQRLDSDPKLRRWQSRPDLKDEIRETIANKAEGMFRWAACQLDALENCLNVSMLRTTLASLPNSLDDMYAAALKLVPNEHTQLVSKLLQWLAFSTRPLYIEEIAEIATVDIASVPKFDPDRRLFDARDIVNLCPNIFVAVTKSSDGDSADPPAQQLYLAHFSVKEYLLSDQIRTSDVRQFGMTEQDAHSTIAADCLAYLLQFDRPYIEALEVVRSSPLLRYATNYWPEHVKRSEEEGYNKLEPHVLELLNSDTVYANWTAFLEGYTPFSSDEEGPNSPPDPLYYAASYGLSRVCETLIRNGSPVDSLGQAGTALAAACLSGSTDAVRVLVDNGADVNASGPLGPPLLLAAGKGAVEIVECLLQTGADVRYGSETGETALVEALRYGHKDVARLLQS